MGLYQSRSYPIDYKYPKFTLHIPTYRPYNKIYTSDYQTSSTPYIGNFILTPRIYDIAEGFSNEEMINFYSPNLDPKKSKKYPKNYIENIVSISNSFLLKHGHRPWKLTLFYYWIANVHTISRDLIGDINYIEPHFFNLENKIKIQKLEKLLQHNDNIECLEGNIDSLDEGVDCNNNNTVEFVSIALPPDDRINIYGLQSYYSYPTVVNNGYNSYASDSPARYLYGLHFNPDEDRYEDQIWEKLLPFKLPKINEKSVTFVKDIDESTHSKPSLSGLVQIIEEPLSSIGLLCLNSIKNDMIETPLHIVCFSITLHGNFRDLTPFNSFLKDLRSFLFFSPYYQLLEKNVYFWLIGDVSWDLTACLTTPLLNLGFLMSQIHINPINEPISQAEVFEEIADDDNNIFITTRKNNKKQCEIMWNEIFRTFLTVQRQRKQVEYELLSLRSLSSLPSLPYGSSISSNNNIKKWIQYYKDWPCFNHLKNLAISDLIGKNIKLTKFYTEGDLEHYAMITAGSLMSVYGQNDNVEFLRHRIKHVRNMMQIGEYCDQNDENDGKSKQNNKKFLATQQDDYETTLNHYFQQFPRWIWSKHKPMLPLVKFKTIYADSVEGDNDQGVEVNGDGNENNDEKNKNESSPILPPSPITEFNFDAFISNRYLLTQSILQNGVILNSSEIKLFELIGTELNLNFKNLRNLQNFNNRINIQKIEQIEKIEQIQNFDENNFNQIESSPENTLPLTTSVYTIFPNDDMVILPYEYYANMNNTSNHPLINLDKLPKYKFENYTFFSSLLLLFSSQRIIIEQKYNTLQQDLIKKKLISPIISNILYKYRNENTLLNDQVDYNLNKGVLSPVSVVDYSNCEVQRPFFGIDPHNQFFKPLQYLFGVHLFEYNHTYGRIVQFYDDGDGGGHGVDITHHCGDYYNRNNDPQNLNPQQQKDMKKTIKNISQISNKHYYKQKRIQIHAKIMAKYGEVLAKLHEYVPDLHIPSLFPLHDDSDGDSDGDGDGDKKDQKNNKNNKNNKNKFELYRMVSIAQDVSAYHCNGHLLCPIHVIFIVPDHNSRERVSGQNNDDGINNNKPKYHFLLPTSHIHNYTVLNQFLCTSPHPVNTTERCILLQQFRNAVHESALEEIKIIFGRKLILEKNINKLFHFHFISHYELPLLLKQIEFNAVQERLQWYSKFIHSTEDPNGHAGG